MQRRSFFAVLAGLVTFTGIRPAKSATNVVPTTYTVEEAGHCYHVDGVFLPVWCVKNEGQMVTLTQYGRDASGTDPEVVKDMAYLLNQARTERLKRT